MWVYIQKGVAETFIDHTRKKWLFKNKYNQFFEG